MGPDHGPTMPVLCANMGSIEKRANGKSRARWRDTNGRTQSRVCERKTDAERKGSR